jgi:GNAT superfamily N-acetyltransferase
MADDRQIIDFNPIYPWIRSRLLEGTWPGGPDVGAWPTSGKRVHRAWGLVEQSEWSYGPDDAWPPDEPPNLDQLAKKHRHNRYVRIRSAADCDKALATHTGVVTASFDIVHRDWGSAPQGRIPLPAKGVIPDVGHRIALIPLDDKPQQFAFPNSWGVEWGDRGWGYMTHAYFDRFVTDAWFMDAHKEEFPPYESNMGIQYRDWMHYDVFGRALLAVEVNDLDKDERIGWCFLIDLKPVFEVEEFFVMPAYRRKGYGTELMKRVLEAAQFIDRSVLFWISHPDWNANQRPITQAFLENFGFVISGRDVRWASAKATLTIAPPMRSSEPPIPPPLAPAGPLWCPK